ncbi:hypothetical protein [Sphingomonas bacterium]|uniref:hypothetical protein n=1 Tax=Sphingomonas bacterium TaxID=1895847 RepID=UPI001576066E|nr:hypothetical protein [Sphingomonas bacterium]
MNATLGTLVMFALAAFVGVQTYDNYRMGKMQVVTKNISPVFDRIDDAIFFWGATAINVAVTSVCTIGGLILLAGLFIR